jgi:hypothetical protein
MEAPPKIESDNFVRIKILSGLRVLQRIFRLSVAEAQHWQGLSSRGFLVAAFQTRPTVRNASSILAFALLNFE